MAEQDQRGRTVVPVGWVGPADNLVKGRSLAAKPTGQAAGSSPATATLGSHHVLRRISRLLISRSSLTPASERAHQVGYVKKTWAARRALVLPKYRTAIVHRCCGAVVHGVHPADHSHLHGATSSFLVIILSPPCWRRAYAGPVGINGHCIRIQGKPAVRTTCLHVAPHGSPFWVLPAAGGPRYLLCSAAGGENRRFGWLRAAFCRHGSTTLLPNTSGEVQKRSSATQTLSQRFRISGEPGPSWGPKQTIMAC